jgi:5-methylcytosine-specific restriction protein B
LVLAVSEANHTDDPFGPALGDTPVESAISVWWVNQGTSYAEERDGGFIWAPLETDKKAKLAHWTRLREIADGDVVVHYAKGSVRAVGKANGSAIECPRPDELPADWTVDGLRVEIDYRELLEPIPLDQIPIEWRKQEGSPFTRGGTVQQGYCFGPLSDLFRNQLGKHLPELQDFTTETQGGTQTMTLEERIQQWRDETDYPREGDRKRQEQRVKLAAALSSKNLEEVVADPEQFDLLNFGQFAANAYGGPGPQAHVHRYVNTGPEAKRRLAEAMNHLIYDTEEPETSRLDDVILSDDWRVPGFGESLSTKALAVAYPDEWLPLFKTEGPMGKRVLMKSPELDITEPDDLDERTVGQRIKWSNDALRTVLDPYFGNDPLGQSMFLYWLRDQQQPESEEALATVAQELYLDPPWLTEVVELLKEKKQIIFQGPPGTGKTYVARRLAQHFEELGGGKEIVQFHPSYAYEDFVEGYRPRLVGDQPGFELVEGPLRRLARTAEKDPDHIYVLVIDELNRGNVAKVFGELYYLLEYRGDRIQLQYSDESGDESEDAKFRLPKNLWIIATTNTADRSIALMDSALRRRFYFIDYYPDKEPVSELLERWLKDHDLWSEFGWLRDLLFEANRRLGEREAAIGPSHFLLKDPSEVTDERVERIWNHAVLPYLEEQLLGEPERRKEFELSSLRKALEAPKSGAAATPETAESDAGDEPSPASPE